MAGGAAFPSAAFFYSSGLQKPLIENRFARDAHSTPEASMRQYFCFQPSVNGSVANAERYRCLVDRQIKRILVFSTRLLHLVSIRSFFSRSQYYSYRLSTSVDKRLD